MAKKYYKNVKIKIKINYFLDDLKKKIKQKFLKKKNTKKKNILYLTEPVEAQAVKLFKNKYHWGFNEFDLMTLFINRVKKISKNFDLILRVHPSENKKKYLKFQNKLKFRFSKNKDILKDIGWADVIVGLDTMAMVIGLFSKKKVFTTLPFKKKKITLPFKKIKKIIDL